MGRQSRTNHSHEQITETNYDAYGLPLAAISTSLSATYPEADPVEGAAADVDWR